jgi:hypothetical protein
MLPNTTEKPHQVFEPSSALLATFPAAARLEGSAVEGTVGAAAAPVGEPSYSAGSNALLRDAPLTHAPHGEPRPSPFQRAGDLISELREISGQVNRMMTQVDRAIHRLGEHAGEPLRR